MMSSRPRRAFATLALTAALSLLAAGPAQAARRDSDPTPVRVTETARALLQEVWTRFVSLWEAASSGMDGNGGR